MQPYNNLIFRLLPWRERVLCRDVFWMLAIQTFLPFLLPCSFLFLVLLYLFSIFVLIVLHHFFLELRCLRFLLCTLLPLLPLPRCSASSKES